MWKSKAIKLVLMSLVILALMAGSACGFNHAPEISSLVPSSTTLTRGESCTITCYAIDWDKNDILTYIWSATGGSISGTGSAITWIAPPVEGTYTITVTVSDGKLSESESRTIQVVNTPPVIASLTPSATSVLPNGSCTINCVATDADGDTLTYEWTADDGLISGIGGTVTWEAPATDGTYTITVDVNDGKGGIASETCQITVEMKYGSINIQSDPAGAAVFLNGVDTGNITPFVITDLTPGSYTVMLDLFHYKYRQATLVVNPNETTYINWSLTYAPQITLTIQPDAAAGKDSGATTFGPDVNWGDNNELVAGNGTWGIYRSYLRFDLGSLPENAVITDARLGLFYWNSYGSVITPVGAYAVLGPWEEMTITWNNQPNLASMWEYSINVPSFETNDFMYWYITDLVEGWRNGSITNYGVVLMDTNETTAEAEKGFRSSDWSTAAERPKLVIYYYDPIP